MYDESRDWRTAAVALWRLVIWETPVAAAISSWYFKSKTAAHGFPFYFYAGRGIAITLVRLLSAGFAQIFASDDQQPSRWMRRARVVGW